MNSMQPSGIVANSMIKLYFRGFFCSNIQQHSARYFPISFLLFFFDVDAKNARELASMCHELHSLGRLVYISGDNPIVITSREVRIVTKLCW